MALDQLSEENKADIIKAFRTADYGWTILSLVPMLLSHMSRAYRWKYTLAPLGYQPNYWNSFMAVMVGYFVNLGIPRAGEVARCGLVSRYEKIPFTKVVGTVVAERIADLIILLGLASVVVYLQLPIMQEYLVDTFGPVGNSLTNPFVLVGIPLVGIISLVVFYRVVNRSQNPLIQKISELVNGLIEGVLSIWRMKQKWAFLGHTVFIWTMYVAMFYICIFSMPNVANVAFAGVLAAFVVGGFAIVVTPGGFGAFPYVVMKILALYAIAESDAYAFGWLVWTAQTVMLVALGGLSMLYIPIFNKSRDVDTEVTPG